MTRIGRVQSDSGYTKIGNHISKKVEEADYLGSRISYTGKIQHEITKKIGLGDKFYDTVKHILWDWKVSK